jgi:hypothetical protein
MIDGHSEGYIFMLSNHRTFRRIYFSLTVLIDYLNGKIFIFTFKFQFDNVV